MKNLKIKLGLFSLLAIFAASVFLTSCEQEEVFISELSNESYETSIYKIDIPKGMSEEEAIQWVKNTPISEFTKLDNSEGNDLLEYRATWCSGYYNTGSTYLDTNGCWCTPPGYDYGPYCVKTCTIYRKDCVVWNVPNPHSYSVTQYRNCNC